MARLHENIIIVKNRLDHTCKHTGAYLNKSLIRFEKINFLRIYMQQIMFFKNKRNIRQRAQTFFPNNCVYIFPNVFPICFLEFSYIGLAFLGRG